MKKTKILKTENKKQKAENKTQNIQTGINKNYKRKIYI